MKYAIHDRWSGAMQFEAEIDCAEDQPRSVKIGTAVVWAINAHADLTRADLTDANLIYVDLSHADLTHADLTHADLTDADLTHADLTHADLTRADLTDADLSDTDLSYANLTDADLTRANVTDANLTGANLTGANLAGALRPIRVDLFDILLHSRAETPALLTALRAGRIDGAVYYGPCACLCGTIAKARGVLVEKLGFADASRPAERWFLPLRAGDTPSNNQIAKITESWVVEFMALAEIAENIAEAQPAAPLSGSGAEGETG